HRLVQLVAQRGCGIDVDVARDVHDGPTVAFRHCERELHRDPQAELPARPGAGRKAATPPRCSTPWRLPPEAGHHARPRPQVSRGTVAGRVDAARSLLRTRAASGLPGGGTVSVCSTSGAFVNDPIGGSAGGDEPGSP